MWRVHGGVCGIVQVPLMVYADRAVAALDGHRAVAGVMEAGLHFLDNLALADSNQVCHLASSRDSCRV